MQRGVCIGCIGCVDYHPTLSLHHRGGRLMATTDVYIRHWEMALRKLGFSSHCGETFHSSLSIEQAIRGLCANGVLCTQITPHYHNEQRRAVPSMADAQSLTDQPQVIASATDGPTAATSARAFWSSDAVDVPMADHSPQPTSWRRARPMVEEDDLSAMRRRLQSHWLSDRSSYAEV